MIVLDFETTGLVKPHGTKLHLQPFITEIGAAKINFECEVITSISQLIKPPVPIPDEVVEITGITNEMVSSCPTFAEFYPTLCDFFLGEKVMFAHNCGFDAAILMFELQRIGCEFRFPWPQWQYCTVELTMPIRNKRIKLTDLYRMATGKELLNAHRALDDVLGLVKVIEWLKKNEMITKQMIGEIL